METNSAMESIALLEEAYDERTLLQVDKQNLIDAVLTPDIKAKLAEIDAEFEQREADLARAIVSMEERVKAQVAVFGETVRGLRIQAVFTKPRVTWDSTALDGYATAYPDLLKFRSVGEPSVSIRIRK